MSQPHPMKHGASVVNDEPVSLTLLRQTLVPELRAQARSRVTKALIIDRHSRQTVQIPRYTCAQQEEMLEWRAADEIERLRRVIADYEARLGPTPVPALPPL
jgi:hypothetical protein